MKIKGGDIVARSEAMDRAIKKYEKEKVERIIFRVPKGKKEIIKKHADQCGESVNAFINRAIDEVMGNDKKENM